VHTLCILPDDRATLSGSDPVMAITCRQNRLDSRVTPSRRDFNMETREVRNGKPVGQKTVRTLKASVRTLKASIRMLNASVRMPPREIRDILNLSILSL
jgi:hypothetical protein